MLAGEHSHARGLAPPLLAAGLLACRFGTSFKLDKAPGLPLLLLAMPSTGRAQAVQMENGKSKGSEHVLCASLPSLPFHPSRCAAAASADRSQGEPVARERLSRVSTAGSSRLSSSSRLH